MNAVIISGGSVNKKFIKEYLDKYSFGLIIAVDKGLEVLDDLKILPNFILGDFDSVNKKILSKYENNKNIIIKKYKPEKDYTDTHIAVKLAIDLKVQEIILLGGIGNRLDHTISNIQLLKEPLYNNIKAKIIDKNNIIQLINKNILIQKEYDYISLIPISEEVTGICLEGFKYSLNNAKLKIGDTIGISNEQIAEIAEIKLKDGILMIIQSKD